MRAAGAARVWAFAVDALAEAPGLDLDGVRVLSPQPWHATSLTR